jgi:beta-glucosidase
MSLRRFAVLLINILIAISPCLAQQSPPYKNSALPIDSRVKDLLKRMTLEEKVAQLESTWQNQAVAQEWIGSGVTSKRGPWTSRDGRLHQPAATHRD